MLSFNINDANVEYLTDLPDTYVKIPDLWQLFSLIDTTKGRTKENMQVRSGITLLIFNPQSKEYYPRYLCEHTDREALYKYFKDGNLFISKDDIT